MPRNRFKHCWNPFIISPIFTWPAIRCYYQHSKHEFQLSLCRNRITFLASHIIHTVAFLRMSFVDKASDKRIDLAAACSESQRVFLFWPRDFWTIKYLSFVRYVKDFLRLLTILLLIYKLLSWLLLRLQLATW